MSEEGAGFAGLTTSPDSPHTPRNGDLKSLRTRDVSSTADPSSLFSLAPVIVLNLLVMCVVHSVRFYDMALTYMK